MTDSALPPPSPPNASGTTAPPTGPAPPSNPAPPTPSGATSPGAPPQMAPGDLDRPRSDFGTRLGGWLLDGLLYGLVTLAFVVPGIIMVVAAFADCSTTGGELTCPDGSPSAGWITAGVVTILLGVGVVVAIYLRSLGRTGQTWGRSIVGVKVIDARTGTPIGIPRALGRQLFANVFSTSVFYLGYLWMLWDDQQQTWHDKAVGSVVVDV